VVTAPPLDDPKTAAQGGGVKKNTKSADNKSEKSLYMAKDIGIL